MSVILAAENGLTYRTATLHDTESVWELMKTEFYPRTELCTCLQMRLPQDVEILHELLPGILKSGVSLVAEDVATGRLVAARPTTVDQLDESQPRHPLLSDSDLANRYAKCSSVYRMFDHLSSSVDLAKIYKVDRAMSFKFLVVAESHSRRGIAKRLVELSLELAAKFDLPLATTCAASRYSERIYDSLGFDRVSELRLRDYVDSSTGKKPFALINETVLTHAVLYAKKL